MLGTLAVAAGGAAGSLLRYWATLLAARLGGAYFPWSTIAINIAGSFLIGWFATATLPGGPSPASHETRLLVMTGLCGGFTTFSAFSLQTIDLARTGDWTAAAANVLLSVVLCLAAAALGHWTAAP
ncbi:MAG: fluoride efflux transporter CrcB [Acetobacteraceae bacterium]|nr:fluoride efflux transporter CrcB [Acetobacteraceae bacterium]